MLGPSICVVFSIHGKNFLRVHLATAQRERFHARIVDRRGRAMIMRVVMMIVPVRMIVVMIVMVVVAVGAAHMVGIVVIEEVRVIVEHTLQIERATVQNLGQRNAGAFGAVNAGPSG